MTDYEDKKREIKVLDEALGVKNAARLRSGSARPDGDRRDEGSDSEQDIAFHTTSPPPTITGGNPDNKDLRKALGEDITTHLMSKNSPYHPVIIFGATGAGKTILLASLLSNFHNTVGQPGAEIRIGSSICSRDSSMYDRAVFFMENTTEDFRNGIGPSTTQLEPFFIPVEVRSQRPPLHEITVGLAFLESRGESQTPEKKVDTKTASQKAYREYRALPDEVSEVLKGYSGAVSVIYVAPYVVPEDAATDPDLTLKSKMLQFCKAREGHETVCDRHLFLLTMWDEHNQDLSHRDFSHPKPHEVISVIKQRFGSSWEQFESMRDRGGGASRYFMQYSVGRVINDDDKTRILRGTEDSEETLRRYARTVLNWLYGNALYSHSTNVVSKDVLPAQLFPDAVPRKRTWSDHILALLGDRR